MTHLAGSRTTGVVAAFVVLACFAPHAVAAEKGNKPDPASDFFEHGPLPRLHIEIAPPELDKLRQQPRTYVTCTVREALPELSMSSAGSRRRQMIYETKFVPREPTQPTLLSGLARG